MKKLSQLNPSVWMGVLAIFISSSPVFSQKQNNPVPYADAVNVALRHIETQQSAWNLTVEDLRNVMVQDHYVTEANGLTHVFILQTHGGIPVFNGLVNLS